MNLPSIVTVAVGTFAVVLSAGSAIAHPDGGIQSMDLDGDGQVSFEEFQPPQRDDGRSMFAKADADGDGSVTRDEIIATIAEASEERSERALERFDETDADGNGIVTGDEAKQQLFARIDSNGDGFLTEDEVRAMRDHLGDRRDRRGNRESRGPQE